VGKYGVNIPLKPSADFVCFGLLIIAGRFRGTNGRERLLLVRKEGKYMLGKRLEVDVLDLVEQLLRLTQNIPSVS
jgi:hypothetical protein